MKLVEIVDRNGWKYAKIKQRRGAGASVFRRLGTKSFEQAEVLVREAKLEEIALAAQADALTREVWTRLLAGRNVRVRDTIESYETHRHIVGDAASTIYSQGIIIDQFIRTFDLVAQPISAVDVAQVADFTNRAGPQTLATRQKWLEAIKGWLKFCVERRWIVVNPADQVAVRIEALTQEQLVPVPHAAFTEDEVKLLLSKVPRTDFWHGAVLLGYEYGLRLGAVATLEDGNVVANRLRVFTSKGRKVVDEPLADSLWVWLQEWRRVRPASDIPHLFPAQAAAPTATLSKQFERLLAKVGIEGRSFHGLRKTATAKRWDHEISELGTKEQRALTALIAKRGFRAVQEMLAHAQGSEVTTKHYMPHDTRR